MNNFLKTISRALFPNMSDGINVFLDLSVSPQEAAVETFTVQQTEWLLLTPNDIHQAQQASSY